jgi:CBS domain-containing protein
MVRPSWRHGVRRDQDDGRQGRRRVVVLDASKIVGIVTERDYARTTASAFCLGTTSGSMPITLTTRTAAPTTSRHSGTW